MSLYGSNVASIYSYFADLPKNNEHRNTSIKVNLSTRLPLSSKQPQQPPEQQPAKPLRQQ